MILALAMIVTTQLETGEIQQDHKLYDHQLMGLELSKTHKIVSMAGSVQNGKSVWGILQLKKFVKDNNPGPDVERVIWIVIPDRKKYWEPLKPKIENVFGWAHEGGIILERNLSKPSYTLMASDGGAPWECFIISVKDPDTARSATICAAMMSEAGICEEQAFDNLLGRLAMRQGPLFVESSPFGLNWYWHRVVNNAKTTVVYRDGVPEFHTNPAGDPRVASIYGVRIEDNLAMSREEIATLRAGTSSENAKREYDGAFFQWSGLVWKKFRPVVYPQGHIIDPPTLADFQRFGKYGDGWSVISGMDFGFTHPFAHVWVARKGIRYIVLSEYRNFGETSKTHSDAIKADPWNKYSEYRYRDPAGAQAAADMEEFGINSDEGSNEVEPGLDCLERLFESNNLLVSRACAKLVNEIGNYHRDEKTGKPVAVAEDLCCALRYVVYSDWLANGSQPLPHYSQEPHEMRPSVKADTEEAKQFYSDVLVEEREDMGMDAGKEVV